MDPMITYLKEEWNAPVEKGALSVCSYFRTDWKLKEWTEKRFKSFIKELTGEDIVFADPRKEGRTVTMHLIQQTMLASIGTDKVCTFEQVDLPDPADIPKLNPKALLDESVAWAAKYIKENPWVFVETEDEDKLDAYGNPKPKKGAKQVLAFEVYSRLIREGATRKDIIQAFQDEVDMSKAGATTYFYNMKKKYENEDE